MRDSTVIRRFFESVPVNRFLGYRLVSCSSEGVELRMPPRAEYAQEGGVVQGGLLGALADTASAYAFVPGLADDEGLTGVEFKINFLRPARPQGGELVARGRVVRRGRRLGVAEVEVEQEGRAVARGTFTYLFHPRRAGGAGH